MKKILSLVLWVLISIGVMSACRTTYAQPSSAGLPLEELTVIVMDTTQALLPYVEVQCGSTVLKTSFDGRVVLSPEQLNGVKKIELSSQGYKTKKVALSGYSSPLIVYLTRDRKKPKDDVLDSYEIRAYGRPSLRASKHEKMLEDETDYEEVVVACYGMPGVTKETTRKVAVVNNISAGKLTAGEVNDFAKWYFWHTVMDSTHKAYVGTWNLEPRERYTVQVMNKDGFPVANYPVNLTDNQGNTVFQAITDNTGKAELWNGLIKSNAELAVVKEPEKVIIVDELCDAPDGVDVMFVFDATGSMGDELQYLQAEMKDVIARAKEATGGLAIRTGAVVYRDHGDDYITRISRLTEEIETTKKFIDAQEAFGGGDFPEAVPEALMAALNSSGWDSNARARIAFLILDAPCHEDSATIALLQEQILNAAAQGIRIVPVVCSSMNKAGELLMRSIALATNGTSFFLTDDSGIGHQHLKPTTDSLKVEHLNDMLVRTIVEFSAMPACNREDLQLGNDDNIDEFIPNPFNEKELEEDPTIPHGEGIHYLVDISGKLLGIYEGEVPMSQLPIGVYFIKTYINGQWITEKILKR